MEVIRVNKVRCGLRELMHRESPTRLKEVEEALQNVNRGSYSLPSPIKRWEGGVLSTVDFGDTELVLRYIRMKSYARKAFVNSICYLMNAKDVREMEVEVPWGTSVKRELYAAIRTCPDDSLQQYVYLSLIAQKK